MEHRMSGLSDLVKSFEEDLLREAVDVDKYYREVEDAIRKTPLSNLVGALNEALKQYLEVSLDGVPHPILMAGALFMAACESEEPDRSIAVLFGYSCASLAAGRALDAAVFLLASIAAVRGRRDVAMELLKKINLDLEGLVKSACGAVGLAKLLEGYGISAIPD
jgi:hypothetical protein